MTNELKHYGILGMKWGIRRFQNYDGSYTHAGKERYGFLGKKKKALKVEEPKSKFVKFKGLLTDDVKNQYKDIASKYGPKTPFESNPLPVINKDGHTYIPKGTELYRVSTKNEPIDDRRKYVSITELDKRQYEDWAREGVFGDADTKYTYKAITDIKVAEGKEVLDYIIDKYGDFVVDRANKFKYEYEELPDVTPEGVKNRGGSKEEAEFIKDIGDKYTESERLVYSFLHDNLYVNKSIHNKVIQEFIKRGYDAIVDIEDAYTGFMDMPLILLSPKGKIEQEKMEFLHPWTPHEGEWT